MNSLIGMLVKSCFEGKFFKYWNCNKIYFINIKSKYFTTQFVIGRQIKLESNMVGVKHIILFYLWERILLRLNGKFYMRVK